MWRFSASLHFSLDKYLQTGGILGIRLAAIHKTLRGGSDAASASPQFPGVAVLWALGLMVAGLCGRPLLGVLGHTSWDTEPPLGKGHRACPGLWCAGGLGEGRVGGEVVETCPSVTACFAWGHGCGLVTARA